MILANPNYTIPSTQAEIVCIHTPGIKGLC